MIAGAVLAAGEGRRFGGPKQLADLQGRPLLEHAIAAMAAVPALERLVVVLGAHADAITAAVDFNGAEPLLCADWQEGMSASLRCAGAALADAEAILVILGDQPLITPQVIAAVLDGIDEQASAVRATYDGAPGHPVLLKRALFPRLAALRGDVGARELLRTVPVVERECGHLCRPDDIDTPAELDRVRERVRAG